MRIVVGLVMLFLIVGYFSFALRRWVEVSEKERKGPRNQTTGMGSRRGNTSTQPLPIIIATPGGGCHGGDGGSGGADSGFSDGGGLSDGGGFSDGGGAAC